MGQFRDVGMASVIVLRWMLTWFDFRPNEKSLWMWQWTFRVHKQKEFLDYLCNCQLLKNLLHIIEVFFTLSLLQNPMNVSHVVCPVVLFCSYMWPMSTTSRQWLLVWIVAIVCTGDYLLSDIREYAGIGSVSTGAD